MSAPPPPSPCSGHTKGEWSAFKCPKSGGVSFSPKDRKGQWLVKFKDEKYTGEIGVFIGEDAEANAKLFAGSKSLLEACKAALPKLSEADDHARNLILAALHLATGGQL